MTNITGYTMANVTSNITHIEHTTVHPEDHREHAEGERLILFVFSGCAVGALVRLIFSNIKVKLPYTVVLLLLGVTIGAIAKKSDTLKDYIMSDISNANPHVILHVFLPVLIFESAFAMEFHTFKKAFLQVLILAVPGLALATVMTSFLAVNMFSYNWDWITGMMFGSILSATDPVAVVAILRETGASKQLAMVTEGESLFNDGAAIVLFNLFLKFAVKSSDTDAQSIILNFLQVAIGGPAFGFAMAVITIFWLSRIFNDAIVEITITLSMTYLTFYVAEEFLQVSGVLAVVLFGITIGSKKTCISPEVELFLHRLFERRHIKALTRISSLVTMAFDVRPVKNLITKKERKVIFYKASRTH